MYNANRLARAARKAEREGRTFQANGLWGQVATKAESVLVRHPTSKYAREAELLRGVALARLGQCQQALGPLNQLTFTTSRSELTEDALLASGRCQLAAGNFAVADAAFSELLQSKDSERRREARFQHARLLRQTGQFDEALKALEGIDGQRADHERILSLAGSDRVKQALALADSLIARGDTAKHWDSLVVLLGPKHPVAASGLIDRVRRLPGRNPSLQARMLIEDGLRLVSVDRRRAAQRFREAIKVAPMGEGAGRASVALIRMDLERAQQAADLIPIVDTLSRLANRFDVAGEEINRIRTTATEVHRIAAGALPDTSRGDLHLFLGAESARDVLRAPRLAEAMFRMLPERWPASPYAAKAILAAQQLNPAWVDSARALLEERYFDSPYLATVRGEASDAYRQLEDSLGAFASSVALLKAKAAPRKPTRPVVPGRRPQPAPQGGSRVPVEP
jgi:tetratricopeptide (TPR) repeat protein